MAYIYVKPLKVSKWRFELALYAGVVKLANTLDLGSSVERLAGSSPVTCTKALIDFDYRLPTTTINRFAFRPVLAI